jgi:ferredoxin/flavodoxin---NADP+ reductase
MATWIKGRVVEHKHWNAYLHTLCIEADLAPFAAGQFVKLGLEIDGKVVAHPYSLVNPPQQRPLEIFYIEVPDGDLSPHLVDLKPGDTVQLSPTAHGFMMLDEIPEVRDLWLMASGTGIGPFLSMLGTERLWQQYERAVLVYSVRHQQDLAYLDRIQQLINAHPGRLHFVPLVTREASDIGLPCRMQQALQDGRLEKHAQTTLSPEHSHVILCGNPQMVEDMQTLLATRGLKKHRRRDPGHITTETYW